MDDLLVHEPESNEKQLLGFKHQSYMIISVFQNLVDGLTRKKLETGTQVRRQHNRSDKDERSELKKW